MKIIFFFILFAFPALAQAVSGTPAVTDIKSNNSGPTNRKIDFTYQMLPGQNSESISVCQGSSLCMVGYGIFSGGKWETPGAIEGYRVDLVNKDRNYTWDIATTQFQWKNGNRRTFRVDSVSTPVLLQRKFSCIAFGAFAAGRYVDGGDYREYIFEIMPGTECIEIPTTPFFCNVKQTSINVAFGQMPQQQVNGATRTARLTLDCSMEGQLNIRQGIPSPEPSVVDIRPGELSAKLALNGVPINAEPLKMLEGLNNLDLSVQLQTQGVPEPGAFSAQTVLVVSYP